VKALARIGNVFSSIFCAFIVHATLVVYARISERDAIIYAFVAYFVPNKFDTIANELLLIRERLERSSNKDLK